MGVGLILDIHKFNVGKQKDEEIKQRYLVKISNMFGALKISSEDVDEIDIIDAW